jgi:hypothetical protein
MPEPALGELVEHVHAWIHPAIGAPLLCRCGELWPGAPLPEQYMKYEGYGAVGVDHVPWGRRVDAMVNELADREEQRAAALELEG